MREAKEEENDGVDGGGDDGGDLGLGFWGSGDDEEEGDEEDKNKGEGLPMAEREEERREERFKAPVIRVMVRRYLKDGDVGIGNSEGEE